MMAMAKNLKRLTAAMVADKRGGCPTAPVNLLRSTIQQAYIRTNVTMDRITYNYRRQEWE